MKTSYLFCFAAKSLQSYIMRGGKLRDMVGATSLIDKLSDKEWISKWLKENHGFVEVTSDKGESKADPPPNGFRILQAAAGSARLEFFEKAHAEAVATLWPLWCHAWAPDLEVVQHLEAWDGKSYGQISRTTGEQLERKRNFPAPCMPEAGPFAKRAPRAGEPAVEVDYAAEKELIDLASKRKRQEREALRNAEQLPPVARAFGFEKADQLPDDFEQVSGGNAYLAVIHADGNGLGQMFLRVGQALEKLGPERDKEALALFRYLSEVVVARGTQVAADAAMSAVRRQIDETVKEQKAQAQEHPEEFGQRKVPRRPEAWPFAPVVLAGDDVTVVCRADLGLPFTTAFLQTFRAEMRKRLKWLRDNQFPSDADEAENLRVYDGLWRKLKEEPGIEEAIPEELSAGAGIVFCTDHYPFALAYELCEDLARRSKGTAKNEAKGRAKPTPDSALSFVRITGASAPTEFDELTRGILRGAGVDRMLLTGGPYFVDGALQPQFRHLNEVYMAARPRMVADPAHRDDRSRDKQIGLPGSALRGILNLQRTLADPRHVREAVERMEEVARSREGDGGRRKEAWREFATAWKTLCGWNGNEEAKEERDWRDLRFFDASRKASPLGDLLTLLAVRDKEEDSRLSGGQTRSFQPTPTPAATS